MNQSLGPYIPFSSSSPECRRVRKRGVGKGGFASRFPPSARRGRERDCSAPPIPSPDIQPQLIFGVSKLIESGKTNVGNEKQGISAVCNILQEKLLSKITTSSHQMNHHQS
ncbi:hypothetical protein SEVIR_4G251901v4 [Setaria viridis]